MTNEVLQLLRDRHRQASTPGNRTDDARLALVIEGGSSRGAYSAGMTVAIERHGLLPCFDAIYGSSAGALNGAWLLSHRAESTMHAWWTPAIMRGTIDPKRALRRKPVVDTDFLVHHIYINVMPMDFQRILHSPVEFHPIATDADTGRAVDLHPGILDQAGLQAALRATAAMPFLAGAPIEINGHRYVDAGVSESVPGGTAISQGASHLLVLRTRRSDESVSPPTRLERAVLSRWFAKHARGALEPWLNRAQVRAEEEQVLDTHPATLQIRPPIGSSHIGRTERGEAALRHAVDVGIQAAITELSDCIDEPVMAD
jgi:predicted patatin/cPLA2 family phospholipase